MAPFFVSVGQVSFLSRLECRIMDPSNKPGDDSRTEQAPAQSPSLTQRDIATTPPQAPVPLTHSFHPQAQDDFDFPGQPAIKIDSFIEGYQLLENIGRGGMGIVFKAKQPGSGQIVALKMIRAGVFADAESIKRFEREVEAYGKLKRFRNIAPIFHVGNYQGNPFYVMPFFPRGSVALNLKHYSDHPSDTVAIVEKIARAVHHLHETKILHRDIKPGNILLDVEGEPFLSDFGLVKQLDSDHTLTTPHQRLGTPAYMSPEQTGLLVEPVDHRTDVWALGVVLYEMLTGVRPFTAPKGEESTTLLWRIAHEEPRTPRALAPGIDRNLEAVILKCLEKLPRNRFGSAEELAEELKRWLHKEPMQTKPVGAVASWFRKRPAARRAAIALCVFLPAFLLAVVVYRHLADPDRPLHEIQRTFADTGRADLLQEYWPRWHQWSFDGASTLDKSSDGYPQVKSDGVALLLLAKGVGEPFLLKASLRHDFADLQGEIGLFVGLTLSPPDPASPRVFYRCGFKDLFDDKDLLRQQKIAIPTNHPGNQLRLGHVFFAESQAKPEFYDSSPEWVKSAFFEPKINARLWRQLSMRVTPNEIVATIDGKSTAPLNLEKAHKILAERIPRNMEFFPNATPVSPEFQATGGLGILVSRGSASFKDVTIERFK